MARKRVEYIKELLKNIGLEGERVRMVNLSSAMASQYAELATEFTKVVDAIGPNPLSWRPEEEDEWSEAGECMSDAHEGEAHED